MPVRKFRSVAEMSSCPPWQPGDPRIWEEARRRWRIHRFFHSADPIGASPGVAKFKSIAEKQENDRRRRSRA